MGRHPIRPPLNRRLPIKITPKIKVTPKKKFGQNFLLDPTIAHRIAALAIEGISPQTPILEIGAGTGQLTAALTALHPNLTALEIDPDLLPILRERNDLKTVTILSADALTFVYENFAHKRVWRATGNLPYNIATPLILKLIEMHNGPETIVAMIQKDVADRLAASPGTPAYGSLSITVQYAMQVERAFTLPPSAFHPRPKVDSTVVRLTRREQPAVAPRDLALFRQVVRAAFAYRRKTLANSLTLALDRPRNLIAHAIAACNFEPEIRGEQLSLNDFANLADALAEERL